MNSIEAHRLLDLLYHRIDISKPIKAQLHQHFILPCWEGNLVLKKSWKGRLATFLQRPSELKAVEKKVDLIFTQALSHMLNNHLKIEGVDPQFGIKLAQEFPIEIPEGITEPSLKSTPELDALVKIKASYREAALNKKEVISQLSVLREPLPGEPIPTDLDTFNSLFTLDLNDNPEKALSYLEQFLHKNPSYGMPGWQEKLALLRQAQNADEVFLNDVLSSQEKNGKLLQKSAEICADVQNLGYNTKKIICFSYGAKNLSFLELRDAIIRLPKSILDNLPERLQQFLTSEKFSPKEFADDLIHKFFQSIKTTFPKTQGNFNFNKLSPFFEDHNRRIPESVALFLPKIIESYLENTLKKGAIGTAAAFVNDPKVSEAMEWIAHHGDFLLEKDPATLVNTFEEKLQQLLQNYLMSMQDQMHKGVANLYKNSQQLVSPQLLELLGLDKVVVSGPLWLELEKTNDDKYNLAIHTLGNGLNYHPTNPKTGKPYTVMRLTGIQAEKLNQDFFHCLLKRHIEPHWNPQAISKASDVYTGPLDTLECFVAPNLPEDPCGLKQKPATKWQMSLSLLLKKQTPLLNPEFEMRWQALLTLCKSNLSEGILQIQDKPICNALAKAVSQIEADCATMQKESANQTRVEKIQATLNEIKKSIGAFQQQHGSDSILTNIDLQFKQELTSQCKKVFQKMGFSQTQLQEYRGVFSWLLGEEIGELIDTLSQHSKSILPENKLKTAPRESTGILSQYYLGIYTDLASKALKLIAFSAGLYYGGLWYLLEIPVLLTILPFFLPPDALLMYNRIKEALLRKLGELCIAAAIALFVDKKSREQLKALAQTWKQNLCKNADKLLNGVPVTYTLPNKISLPKENEVKIAEKPAVVHVAIPPPPNPVPVQKPLPWTIKGYPLANRTSPIEPSTLLEELNRCMHLTSDASITNRVDFILRQIERLEIPSHQYSTCWDQVQNPITYLESLNKVYHKLMHLRSESKKSRDYPGFIYASYKILSIMDCLARRCEDSNLKGYRINAYPFLRWYKNTIRKCSSDFKNTIDDPFILDQIEQTFNYLLPDIDLKNIPDDKELTKRSTKTLFNYNFTCFEDGHQGPFCFDINGLSESERQYYQAILDAPDYLDKMKSLNLANISKLPTHFKWDILFRESSALFREQPVIPRSYCLLRFQNLQCTALLETLNHGPLYNPCILETAKYSIKILREHLPFFKSISWESPQLIATSSSFSFSYLLFRPFKFWSHTNLSQTEFDRSNTFTFLNYRDYFPFPIEFSEPLKIQFEKIFCENSEQIQHLLIFLKNYKEFFPPTSEMYLKNLIEHVVFKPGVLQKQLTHSKQIAPALGNVLKDLVDFYLSKEVYVSLELIEIALRIKNYCEKISPESVSTYPDFQQLLDDSLDKPKSKHLDSYNRIIKVLGWGSDLQKLTLSQQKIALVDLFQALTMSDKLTINYNNFIKRYYEWQPLIEQFLNDPEMANELLNSLSKRLHVDHLITDQGNWIQGPPLRFRKGNAFIDLAEGNIDIPGAISYKNSPIPEKKPQPPKEIPVPPEAIKANFEGIQRFCSFEKIKAYAFEDQDYLSKFSLGSNLQFNVVKNDSGALEAECQKHPGFYLAEKQTHPSLEGIASYLLLEDKAGKKLVLVKKNQWLQAAISRITALAGPLSKVLMDVMAKTSLEFNDEGFYSFEIEPSSKTNQNSILKSSDPEALVYLLNLYYFQGNRAALELTFQHFEWICNIKPLPDESWMQVLPLLLTSPIDFEGVNHFRRRLMAAMAQNQLIVEPPNEPKPHSWDLLIALAILVELEFYQRNKNPREALSFHQEYFLYKCAFEKLASYIATNTHSHAKPLLDSIGIETMIEVSGLSKTLAKRFNEIKKTLGLKSFWGASAVRLAAEIDRTPSKIPELLYESKKNPSVYHPNNNDVADREGLVPKAARILSVLRNKHSHSLNDLKLEQLFKEMDNGSIFPLPSLNPLEITSEIVATYFPAYYHIAKQQDEASRKLAYALKMLKGTGDKRCQILMTYLNAVIANPDSYPSPIELFLSREEKQEEANYAYTLQLKTPHYLNYPKWYEFFDKLNEITFAAMIGKDVIEPPYQNSMLRFGTSAAIRTAASHFLPQGTTGLVKLGVDMIASAASSTLGEKLIHTGQPLKKHLPSLATATAEIANVDRSFKKIAWIAAKLLAPIALTIASGYAFSATLQKSPESVAEAQQQSYTNYIAYQGLTFVGAAFIRTVFAKIMQRSIRLREVVGPATSSAIHGLSQTYEGLKKCASEWISDSYRNFLLSLGESYREPKEHLHVDYSILEEQDKAVDDFLTAQFNLAFVEEAPKPFPDMQINIPKKAADPILNERYQKAHASIAAYRNDKDSHPTTFRVKDESGLPLIYVNLLHFKTDLEKQVKQEHSLLLDLFNSPGHPKKAHPTPLSLTDIYKLIEKEALGKIGKQVGLSNKELPLVELAVARLDLKTARLHQIERLLAILASIDKSSPSYAEKLEQLAIEFKTTTNFSFKDTPNKILRGFLRFQAEAKTMLWKKQAGNRIKVLSGDYNNVVTEEIPGSGKTYFANPKTAAYLSNGSTLVTPIVPKQLAGDCMREMHQQLWNIFGKRSHVLQSKRDMVLNIRKLEALLALVYGSIKEGEPIQMTKEDAQSFQSIFFDRMHRYRHTPGANTSEEKQCLILLKRILRIFRQHGIAIPDEAHETYSFRKQLNYPIGAAHTIPLDLYTIAEACMREISRDPDLMPLIKSNKLTTLDKRKYRNTIKLRLAEKLSLYWKFNLKEKAKRDEFITFVCDKADKVPDWIASNAKLYSEISLIKGILNNLLPMNFKKRAQVEFAASKKGRGNFARPSDGNSHVLESDSIRLPYASLIKTFLMIQSGGLSITQAKALYDKLKSNTLIQIQKGGLNYKDTYLYRKFGMIIPSLDAVLSEEALKKLSESPEAALLYMRHFIRKEILYWTDNIQNTSQDFAGIFKENFSCTGTPYNDGVYPPNFELMADPTTLGEALNIFFSKCPEDGIHILDTNTPTDILQEILERFFKAGSSFSALIDGGALFTGMDNTNVAKVMAQFCEKWRPDIKEIKYYQEDENGNESVASLRIGKHEGEIKQEECLSYFDQRHGFGANIPQKGDGLCTLGPYHALYKLIQEIFRIRGLKKTERLKAIENILVNLPMQKIHLVMTKEQRNMIVGLFAKNPDLSSIIDYAINNEANIAKKENKPSMQQKYETAPRQRAYDKMMDLDDDNFDAWMGIYDEFESIFVKKQEVDPAKLFGLIKSKGDTSAVLKKAADHAISKIENSWSFTDEEKLAFKTLVHSFPIPPMPEKTTFYGDGHEDLLMDLGLGQTTEQNTEQNTMQQQETQQQTINQDQFQSSLKTYKEWNWPTISTPSSQDWLKFSSPIERRSFFNWNRTCSFFTVQKLLAHAENKKLSQISSMLDSRLWMSNNFVHHWIKSSYEQKVEIGSPMQLDLYEVLVHLKINNGKAEILNMGPLSAREASQWRTKLESHVWTSEDVKTILWNPYTQSESAGYPIDAQLLKNNSDFKTLICQLKFLNGDVKYPESSDELAAWIKAHDPVDLHDAFDSIHRERGIEPFQGKDIDNIFINLRNLPYEEML
jgi:Protein of unknown function (DUF3638)